MAALQLTAIDEGTVIIFKGQNLFVYCPNCHDYMLHRKIDIHPDRSVYQCHICGNRVKLVHSQRRKEKIE